MKLIETILSYELIHVGDYILNVSRVIGVLILFMSTVFGLSLIKGQIHRRSKNAFERTRRNSIFTVVRYFVWVVVIGIVLETLGVHVTIFLAGSTALLIGLGIGVQQVFNDFVSGIILLIEGNTEVDDIIEVDGMVVKVKEISLRTSKVITRDSVTLIIPNHKFISENVINWSHEQGVTRFTVNVGVAYGSNLDLVSRLVLEAMKEQKEVLTIGDFKPMVRFVDFGDSSLNFEGLFFTNEVFRVLNIQSDIRFAINKKFIENDVTIPFPQRDLHIKTSIQG